MGKNVIFVSVKQNLVGLLLF